MSVPNPGSDDAIRLGCKCPVIDNGHGAGFPYEGRVCFYISDICPIHNEASKYDKRGLEQLEK